MRGRHIDIQTRNPLHMKKSYITSFSLILILLLITPIFVTADNKLKEVSSINPSAIVSNIEFEGDIMIVSGGGNNGIPILDISDITDPKEISTIKDHSHYYPNTRLYMWYLFVIPAITPNVTVYDISDPYNPQFTTHIRNSGFLYLPTNLYIVENYLYVFNSNDKIAIYDISNLDEVKEINEIEGPGFVSDIASTDKLLILATKYSGAYIYNVENATSPILMDNFVTENTNTGVAIESDFLYLSDADNSYDQSNIKILDISNPEDPVKVGEFMDEALTYPEKMTIDETTLFVTNTWNGIVAIDISDRSNPKLITHLEEFINKNNEPEPISIVYDVVHYRNYLFTAMVDRLIIFDTIDPSNENGNANDSSFIFQTGIISIFILIVMYRSKSVFSKQ